MRHILFRNPVYYIYMCFHCEGFQRTSSTDAILKGRRFLRYGFYELGNVLYGCEFDHTSVRERQIILSIRRQCFIVMNTCL